METRGVRDGEAIATGEGEEKRKEREDEGDDDGYDDEEEVDEVDEPYRGLTSL